MDPRDLSTAQRNAAVSAGIHTQRAAEARGDPHIIEHHTGDPEAAIRKLKAMGVLIETEAEEVEERD